jgi:hypothetical protein
MQGIHWRREMIGRLKEVLASLNKIPELVAKQEEVLKRHEEFLQRQQELRTEIVNAALRNGASTRLMAPEIRRLLEMTAAEEKEYLRGGDD